MITDLFSHKIHSSGDEWPEKLAELAAIFAEFDGQLYDRGSFEQRLQQISPRASYLAQSAAYEPRGPGGRLDVSKFRDEISAYPAYLGLYFLERSDHGWIVRLSETTKRFLLCEEPDVASFLRLQLPLFQYPNAMGAVYTGFTNNLHIQANARDRAFEFIRNGVHFSPVRLIAVALTVDAELRGVGVSESSVTFREVLALANVTDINRHALPPIENVAVVLDEVRLGNISPPAKFESRFHTLPHTELFLIGNGEIRLRETVNDVDRRQLLDQIDAICRITSQFDGFDHCTTGAAIAAVIADGAWGRYFDGVRSLPSDLVEVLTSDRALVSSMPLGRSGLDDRTVLSGPVAEIYPFRERTGTLPRIEPYSRRREMADPELTRIKMQRRNLAHKELIDKMDAWLRTLGAEPMENDHIDLFAKIPNDGSFIFEMKSGGESILDQVRKGLSQLYEYSYRYRSMIGDPTVSLCLVLPEPPTIHWVTDYLCNDRAINVCWFEDENNLAWPEACASRMSFLIPEAP